MGTLLGVVLTPLGVALALLAGTLTVLLEIDVDDVELALATVKEMGPRMSDKSQYCLVSGDIRQVPVALVGEDATFE